MATASVLLHRFWINNLIDCVFMQKNINVNYDDYMLFFWHFEDFWKEPFRVKWCSIIGRMSIAINKMKRKLLSPFAWLQYMNKKFLRLKSTIQFGFIARAYDSSSKRLLFIDDKMNCEKQLIQRGSRSFALSAFSKKVVFPFHWIGNIEKYCWQTKNIHLPSNFRNSKKCSVLFYEHRYEDLFSIYTQ